MGLKVFARKIKLNNTFAKLVLSYILITILIISILSVVLYKLFLETSLNVIESDSKGRLTQNINSLGLIRSRMVSLGLQMMNNSDVIRSIYGQEMLSPLDKAALYRQLYNIINSDSVIDSIFLYNAKTREINTTFNVDCKDAFTGRMLDLLNEYDFYGGLQLIPSKIKYKKLSGNSAQKNIITAVFYDNAYYNEKSKGDKSGYPATSAILINLNADAIQESISSTTEDQKSETVIIDNKGKVIFDSNKENFASNISNVEFIRSILASGRQEGIFTSKINGIKSLVVYKYTSPPGWMFINLYSYDSLFSKINSLSRIIIYICIFMLIAALVFTFITTRTIFTPFRRLLSNVREGSAANNNGNPNGDSLSDVQYLAQTFNQIKQRTIELESSVKESIPTIKKALLKKVVQGRYNIHQESFKRFDELFHELIDTKGKVCFAVLVFSIDGYMEEKENEQPELDNIMNLSVEALILDTLSKRFYCESIDYENNCMSFLVKLDDDCFISSGNRSFLSKLHEDLQQSLKLKISCSIGMPVRIIEDICLSYSSALDLIKYRLVYGYGSLFYYDMEELVSRESFVPISREKEKLLQAIKACSRDEVKTEVDGIIEEISQCQYDYIMMSLNQLMLDIMDFVKSFFDNDSDKLNYNNIYSNINKIGTLEEMKEFLTLYCHAAIDKLEKKKANRKSDVFQEIIAYIGSHYHENDLTTDFLADMANLTPGYFGKLFAENTGKTVNEYIMDLRLTKGKELLKSTDLTIYDIASKVGFTNSTYFTTLFRKSFDVTPNQFRTNSRIVLKGDVSS